MSTSEEILSRANASLIGNYGRLPFVMDRGEGAFLWDAGGNRYIDLFAGFGGAILGHCHPDLVKAVQDQAAKLWHVGNTFHSLPQTEMAERLVKTAFPGKAFFCHSGLEANEAAIKLARLRGQSFSPRRWKVISMHRSFHGRSLATIAATGNPAIRAGFEPVVPGFTHVDLGDLEGLTAAIDPETAGVIVEPIQGEGGVHQMPLEYAIELRRICDERQITLIFDVIERDNLLGHAQTLGEHAIARLKNEPSIKQKIQQVRGKGLFIGIELKEPPTGIVERGIANGVLINLTSQKVVRLAPPMNIDIETWNQGLDLVVKTIAG